VPRLFHHSDFDGLDLHAVSVILPARECAATIGPIVEALGQGGFGQVAVVDAASADGTSGVAAGAGAEVHQEADLLPRLGPVHGKGDAMWRALSIARNPIVVFVDADTTQFEAHFATGLAGPLLTEAGIHFVKGAYSRPFVAGGEVVAHGGGRVTELTARPLLRAFYPELAGFRQPLAGEFAGRRELLERIPWSTGYAAEIAMLIDVWKEAGIEGMAQVDIGERRQPHQPLPALSEMASTVLAAVCERLAREGRLSRDAVPPHGIVERPPMVGPVASSR
jgi:glucosyl-3-phosphoglycerate synthase